MQYFVSLILIYVGVYLLLVWGLNLQFGLTGIVNAGYILFQGVGAYTAAVLSLGPHTAANSFQHYLGGASLPFPLPQLAAAAVAGLLALVVGLIILTRPLRADYEAIVLLVVAILANQVVSGTNAIVNGATGLALVPAPLASLTHLTGLGYQWFYVGLMAFICLCAYGIVRAITASPFGRLLRAIRENRAAAAAIGKNVTGLRLGVFVLGCSFAGLSGAMLVGVIGTWGPSSWLYPETFAVLTAIIVGGKGNDLGVLIGVLLVYALISEGSQFLPSFGFPGLIGAFQQILVGVLALVFLWLRPQGMFPERRRQFRIDGGNNPRGSRRMLDALWNSWSP